MKNFLFYYNRMFPVPVDFVQQGGSNELCRRE